MLKYVIARDYCHARILVPGHLYEVVAVSYFDIELVEFVKKDELLFNPREAKFFIKIKLDNGMTGDYWNDYFLSTDEVRDINLYRLGL
jgi:hypothetical protein